MSKMLLSDTNMHLGMSFVLEEYLIATKMKGKMHLLRSAYIWCLSKWQYLTVVLRSISGGDQNCQDDRHNYAIKTLLVQKLCY